MVLVVYRDRSAVVPYAAAVDAAGAQPRLEEAKSGIRLGECAGLLLTGGTDVDPAMYGEVRAPETEPPDQERDSLEAALIGEALARDIPLLAICRGMQILNVARGGSLVQHLPGAARHVRRTPDRALAAHSVSIEPGTLLAEVAQQSSWEVNSRHHQAIARLGAGLRICARDPEDGTVEAVDLPGRRFVLAVQWHPEDQAPCDAEQRKLFQRFCAAL
jgi:gamma-glutamyl-gamma-aminobutyrate hydrolase PuuD